MDNYINFINIFLALSALSNLFLFFILLSKTKKTAENLIYIFNVFFIILWCFSMILFRIFDSHIFLSLLYFTPTFIASTFLHFSFLFSLSETKEEVLNRSRKITFSLFYFFNVVVAYLVFFTDKVVVTSYINDGQRVIVFGDYYILYVIYFFLTFSTSFLILFKKWLLLKKEKGTEGKKLSLLLVAWVFSVGISFATNLIAPWYGYFSFNWVGQVFTVLMSFSVVYGMVKYDLFQVKVASVEVFVFLLVSISLIRGFFSDSQKELFFNFAHALVIGVLGFYFIKLYKKEEALKIETDKLNKELIALDERKNEFLNIASHQLKTPMTAILGYARLILEGRQEDHKTTLAYLSSVRDLSNQMFRLIDDMLNITKIEENKLTYRFETLDVNKLVYSLASNFDFRAKEKGLDYKMRIDKEQEIFGTHVDKTLFSQCVENVIDNAVKYTETGFVEVEVCVKDNRFYFVCRDSGLGIDKDSIPKLFTKFQRSKNAIRSGIDGTGIGLFIVKEILQSHNGDIVISSEGEGKGTVCTLWITLR